MFQYPLCSKRSKQLLRNVGSREVGFDLLQRVLLYFFNFELLDLSGLRTKNYWKMPTAVAKEYIERGEHRRCCTIASSTGLLSRAEVKSGAKSISFV